jgi:uncharacterized protein (DUF433 family)
VAVERTTFLLDIRSASRHDAFVSIFGDIYAGRPPEDAPAFTFAEAGLLVAGVPVSTLRSWSLGRRFPSRGRRRLSMPIIQLPKGQKRFLSFTNLVEVHVLAAMHRKRAIGLDALRRVVHYVHDELDVPHPLAHEQFKTNGIDLFVKRLGNLINVSGDDQLGIQAVLVGSLDRVEYDKRGRAVGLFPLLGREGAPKSIVIDPRRAFGRPVLVGTSVPAIDVRARLDAGDGVDELARDYDVSRELIEDALRAGRVNL